MLSVILFIVGFIVGLFLYSQIIFPILYFFPKSLILTIRGELKPIAILRCFLSPIIYFAIFFLIGFFFPSIINNEYVLSPALALGSNLSIVALLYNGFLTKKGRQDLDDDYREMMDKYKKRFTYSDWIYIGNHHFKNEEYTEAITAFKFACFERPQNNWEAHLGLGYCYAEQYEEDEAKEEYNILLETKEVAGAAALYKVLRQKYILDN